MVKVKNLNKRFGDFMAVDGVSFDIRQGEILGLLGPNGAGKTTPIQMVLGLITPTAGEISMFGLPFDRHRDEILARGDVFPPFTSFAPAPSIFEDSRLRPQVFRRHP